MRIFLNLLFLSLSLTAFSQSNNLKGTVFDDTGSPLPSSTVVLLDPDDSTMQYFGITGTEGDFAIKGIKKGAYLLQAAFIGHKTYYKDIVMPYSNDGSIGAILLQANAEQLEGVQVTAERIPLKVNQDTLEYDAQAFKTTADDNVEDLLKKLPGIEVDRSGNITALGEEVNTVLVDGKEFFSNDPTVATKNLPAGALDKVQLYNKKTEEAEFTGIDDGTRNQTINLILNDENKDGVFGDILAGGGTGGHYDAKGKVYKFTDKSQLAALGMINNINKFGFSFGDYISFTGGISNISHGKGGMNSGGFPINFGQSVTGYSSSAAAGLNYSYYKSKYQRIFISYLGSGSKKELEEQSDTWRYKQDDTYFEEDETNQINHDTAHNLTFGARWLFRETNNLIVNGGVSYNTAYIPLNSTLLSYSGIDTVNSLNRTSSDLSDRLSGNFSGTYLKKINEGSTLLKISGNGSYSADNSETVFSNETKFFDTGLISLVNQYQNNTIKSLKYGGSMSLTQKLSGPIYMDIGVSASNSQETMDRIQGEIIPLETIIPSLSPAFVKTTQWIKPSLSLRRNTENMTFTVGVNYNIGQFNTTLDSDEAEMTPYNYFQPRVSWQYRYKTGRRLDFRYSSSANTPTVNQLMPVVNNFNSLSLFYGNRDLTPEYVHSANASWWIFDEFSFTTFLIGIRSTYTQDKINYSRTVNEQLVQELRLINVEDDFTLSGNIDFSTPIRALGIKTNIDIYEAYNKGINIVNDETNEITNYNHKYSLSFDNRKKDKWDINTGVGLSITDARYSIQESLNNVYADMSWFGELEYTPNDKFDFYFSADITNYTAQSFEESQLIPLLGAHISYSFMKNNRMTLTLAGHDLLNKNTGITRISQMNYLQEKTSNIIGRYFMLTLKYRLNKFGGDTGMNVKMRKR